MKEFWKKLRWFSFLLRCLPRALTKTSRRNSKAVWREEFFSCCGYVQTFGGADKISRASERPSQTRSIFSNWAIPCSLP